MSCKCCNLQCQSQCQCKCDCINDWPVEPITLYSTNQLANSHNERIIESLGNEIFVIKAKDSANDEATQRCNLQNIVMPTKLNDTKNLPGILKVCVGARVLLTVNLNVSDGLSNGALGSVVGIRGTQDRILNGIIYVKFDNDVVGASCKVHQGHLKGSVPIQARVDTFELKRKRSDIKVSRKQFPLILAHAITIHKSQSATYKYMVLNFDRSTKNPSKKNSTTQGLAYTGLSRGEERSGIVVKNFDSQIIQANKKALQEMERMRNGRLLKDIWSHPFEKMTGCKLSLLNIVSWNLHI